MSPTGVQQLLAVLSMAQMMRVLLLMFHVRISWACLRMPPRVLHSALRAE